MFRSKREPSPLLHVLLAALAIAAWTRVAHGQVTPAAGSSPPDDTPSVKVGVTLFTDYTYTSAPEQTDAAGHLYHPSSFNLGRAYINVTGNLNHWIAFRITPDVKQETKAVADVTGSYVVRIKYAFAQFNLDDWLPKGTWVRLGIQTTPYIDYLEGIYRYRFQGQVFVEREGYLVSSDAGLSSRFTFPGDYGDVHFGYYNGEGYSKAEVNNEKAFQIRASVRPAPMAPVVKGLRIAAFLDQDAPISGGKRDRLVGDVTFENPHVNAGIEYLDATDQASSAVAEVKSSGWSAWATPKLPKGWEVLLRYDDLKPDKSLDERKKRSVGGVAYWFPVTKGLATALLLDFEQVRYEDYVVPQPEEKRYALHALVNF